jgi:hypothetical protein
MFFLCKISCVMWLALACFAPSLLHATEGYDVAVGATLSITEFSVCKQVTNNSTTNVLWVPTYTASEWSSFYSSPGSATVAACPAACGGASVAGYCWYLGTSNASCDTACASHGGCNLAGTRDYVGTGGSFANCASVANGFGSFSIGGDNGGSAPMGCFVRWGGVYRLIGSTTNCSQGDAFGGQRVCACNN